MTNLSGAYSLLPNPYILHFTTTETVPFLYTLIANKGIYQGRNADEFMSAVNDKKAKTIGQLVDYRP